MSLISITNQQRYDIGYRTNAVTFAVDGGVITGIALS